jgi:GNAT superfamily N-acetyltransferase
MITRVSKLPQESLDQTGEFIFQNFTLLQNAIPKPSKTEEVTDFLRKEGNSWALLSTDHPLALFRFESINKRASLQDICPIKESSIALQDVISTLRSDLQKMGTTEVTIKVDRSIAELFVANGFKEEGELVRFSGRPVQMKMMPLLRLSTITERDIRDLAKLLHAAYTGVANSRFANAEIAESSLQGIMHGDHGKYLSNASFVSGSPGSLVSACFFTLNSSNEANIAELFTHPLYRARGLATTEVAAGMNWLIENKVDALTAWIPNSNEVASRLFTKIGLKEDRRLVELLAKN